MDKTAEKLGLEIVGSTEFVEVAGVKNIPAKIDTGADSSSIWASDIDMEEDGTLIFSLFDKQSPFYTGNRLKTTDYKAKDIRSSNGNKQIRYRVMLPIKLNNKTFTAAFTLANRSKNHFPVLIGRRALEGNFLVDVRKMSVPRKVPHSSTHLNQELQENPYEFHQKYVK
ncbi:ATP-dependent zinc protease [Candidatus Saccharibacteria bacterium]|nr:ATP-dependent zinc protease [Candidatus Saccharibacteria bacterium]